MNTKTRESSSEEQTSLQDIKENETLPAVSRKRANSSTSNEKNETPNKKQRSSLDHSESFAKTRGGRLKLKGNSVTTK